MLAQATGVYDYDFVFYNTGNVDVTLDNFALSNTTLSFSQGVPSNLVIAPGFSETVKISFNSAMQYQDSLSFTTDLPGRTNQKVYIQSGVNFSIEDEGVSNFKIYPNPSSDFLNLEFVAIKSGETKFNIADVEGRIIKSVTTTNP